MDLVFGCVPFSELTLWELYELLQLRQRVFVVEQNCPYLDCDGLDADSLHLLGRLPNGRLGAYARLLPRGLAYPDYAAIGRVITAPEARGQGGGRALMGQAIAQLYAHWGPQPIKIGAQAYLLDFYQSLGFARIGHAYLEDGIPHESMVRPA